MRAKLRLSSNFESPTDTLSFVNSSTVYEVQDIHPNSNQSKHISVIIQKIQNLILRGVGPISIVKLYVQSGLNKSAICFIH